MIASDHLGQTCLEDSASDNEKADHHDHRRVREAGKRLCRGQDLTEEKRQKGAEGHQVGADLAADEQDGRNQ